MKRQAGMPAWCPDAEHLSTALLLPPSCPASRAAQRRRALIEGLQDGDAGAVHNLQAWGSERVAEAVVRYRHSRLSTDAPGNTEDTRTSHEAAMNPEADVELTAQPTDDVALTAQPTEDGHPAACQSPVAEFSESLVVISFGARDGGFRLSQDIRQWMLCYMGLKESQIYHDYASLVGHPLPTVVVGGDGVSRQLNANWNIYFSNALKAAPVMVYIVSEAWTQSAWCALEMRQRGEMKVAKQAPGEGGSAYNSTSHSDPSDAHFEGDPDEAAAAYLDRNSEMSAQLENMRTGWMRDNQTFEDANEGVFKAVAFGSKRNELYVFVDYVEDALKDDSHSMSSSSDAVHRIHDSVAEHQRFYHTPSMSNAEKALELHGLCVRVTEIIEEQAHIEGMRNGTEMHARLMDGVILAPTADGLECSISGSGRTETRSLLHGLRELAAEDEARREQQEQASLAARLEEGRAQAIQRGLVFDTGPCPF